MIGKLKGKVDSASADYLILDVSGVGYKVYCPSKILASLMIGDFAELYIETHVREDHIKLYGFESTNQQKLFNTLQSVKGVGTKMALAILSQLSPNQISIALSSKDINAFQTVSGVGKKLAERIITELKDKFISVGIALPASSLDSSIDTKDTNMAASMNQRHAANNLADTDIISDSVSALVNLGINRSDAYSRVSTVISNHNQTISSGTLPPKPLSIHEVIKLALQN